MSKLHDGPDLKLKDCQWDGGRFDTPFGRAYLVRWYSERRFAEYRLEGTNESVYWVCESLCEFVDHKRWFRTPEEKATFRLMFPYAFTEEELDEARAASKE